MKWCRKCWDKPACERSKNFPKLCHMCGIGKDIQRRGTISQRNAILKRLGIKPKGSQ